MASLFTHASVNCYCRSSYRCSSNSFIHALISQILIRHLLQARPTSMKFCWLDLYFQSDDSTVTYLKIISSKIFMASYGGGPFLFIYHCMFRKLRAEAHKSSAFLLHLTKKLASSGFPWWLRG